MKQTLFVIPPEVFGIPLFGAGLLFGIIVVATLLAMGWALFRKKSSDDFWSSLIFGAIASALVIWVAPAIGKGGGFPIRGYGVFLMFAILFASLLAIWRGKRIWNIPPEILLSVAVIQVVFGILGARLFYVLEYRDSMMTGQLGSTILKMINLTEGGLVVYGSIIGGVVASFLYLIWKKLPILATLDLFAPALMLGIAIGRFGCLMNGCCFGGVCDCPVGITFPAWSPAHYYQLEHGLSSLGGFTIRSAAEEDHGDHASDDGHCHDEKSTKTLFSLKKIDRGIRSDRPGPVVVATVDSGSAAEKAGMKPGTTLVKFGIFQSDENVPDAEINQMAKTAPVGCNDNLFLAILTFYQSGAGQPTFLFDVREPDAQGNPVADGPTKRIVYRPEPPTVRPVHPTQIYSSLGALFLCGLLLYLGRFCRRDGVLFGWMLLFYASGRFLIELVRTDESSFFGTGLTVSQNVAILTGLFAVGLLLFVGRKPIDRRAYAGMFPPESTEKEVSEEKSSAKKSVGKKSDGRKG